jgi:hypothetical protein
MQTVRNFIAANSVENENSMIVHDLSLMHIDNFHFVQFLLYSLLNNKNYLTSFQN